MNDLGSDDFEAQKLLLGRRAVVSGHEPDPHIATAGGAVVVGDTDVYTQATNLSIPWDTPAVIMRYDEVEIMTAPQDSQMVGERFEIATTAKAGELRATRRFEVTSMETRNAG